MKSTIIQSTRIESIDVIRGVVMIIMCLDHTRDYFHFLGGGGGSIAMNPAESTPALFFTRFITHFCAPVFLLLSGTSAFLQSQRKSKRELSKFLFTRGLWLILLEIVLNNFLWNFDVTYSILIFQVIWAIGASMVFLSALIHLNYYFLLAIGIGIVAGHNLLDGILIEGDGILSVFWKLFHETGRIELVKNQHWVGVAYPMLPWLGIMTLGYCLGPIYTKKIGQKERIKTLLILGGGALLLFLLVRIFNLYGDSKNVFEMQDTIFKNIVSFLNVTKYPPSFHYTLVTIGMALFALAFVEHFKNRITDFLIVFGRVPLMFYFSHILLIHFASMLLMPLANKPWYATINSHENRVNGLTVFLNFELHYVYLFWLVFIAILYYPCLKYMRYKYIHKDKKWLSYF